MSDRDLTLQEQVDRISEGDYVKARFVAPGPGNAYRVEGHAWRGSPDGPLRIGQYDMLTFGDGTAHDALSDITEHVLKPQPYAEGTERTLPNFGDVVQELDGNGYSTRTWMYACRGDGSDPAPWLELHGVGDAISWFNKQDGVAWLHRSSLPDRFRLVAELRPIGGEE